MLICFYAIVAECIGQLEAAQAHIGGIHTMICLKTPLPPTSTLHSSAQLVDSIASRLATSLDGAQMLLCYCSRVYWATRSNSSSYWGQFIRRYVRMRHCRPAQIGTHSSGHDVDSIASRLATRLGGAHILLCYRSRVYWAARSNSSSYWGRLI